MECAYKRSEAIEIKISVAPACIALNVLFVNAAPLQAHARVYMYTSKGKLLPHADDLKQWRRRCCTKVAAKVGGFFYSPCGVADKRVRWS